MKRIFILFVVLLLFGCSNQNCITQEEYNLLEIQYQELEQNIESREQYMKYYQNAKDEYFLALLAKADAERYFELWMYYYDESMFAESIGFCEEARTYYFKANTNHQNAIQYFKTAQEYTNEKQNKLLQSYINYCNITIDINWAMYEACEYFESASKHYSREEWKLGDLEREKGNEKINKHDSLIKQANTYSSEIKVLQGD